MRRWCSIPLLLLTSAGFSQVYIGNRGGISIGKQRLNEGDRPLWTSSEGSYGYSLLGGHGGLTIEFPLTDACGLQLELGYVEKGYKVDAENRTTREQLFRLGYADLGVLFKWSALSGNARPEVFAGPVVARTLRLRDEAYRPFVMEPPVTSSPYYANENSPGDHLAPWELSAVAGAGFIFQPGVARIHLNYRFMYGITGIYRYDVAYADANGQVITTGNQYNLTHLIAVGFSLPLSREAWDETPGSR